MAISLTLQRHIERNLLQTGTWIGNIADTTLTLNETEDAVQSIANRHDRPVSIATIPGGILVTAAFSDWDWDPPDRANPQSEGAA